MIVSSPMLDVSSTSRSKKNGPPEYDAIIGTTQPVKDAPEIRDSKAALLDSIPSCVIQVAASVKRGAPDTATRADLLLEPLREGESAKAAKESTPPATPVWASVRST